MSKNAISLESSKCGMVKDDNHRTRALWYNEQEIKIDTHSEAFRLITRIQDEAHRFAISFHRNLRGSSMVHSILDDIEGIGPTRRKGLMKHFKDIEGIRNATVEELEKVAGINKETAINIYNYFQGNKK